MTESSTLTPTQELMNRLGTQHPQKQLLKILDRLEALETQGKKSFTRVEIMAKAREAKKIKRGNLQ